MSSHDLKTHRSRTRAWTADSELHLKLVNNGTYLVKRNRAVNKWNHSSKRKVKTCCKLWSSELPKLQWPEIGEPLNLYNLQTTTTTAATDMSWGHLFVPVSVARGNLNNVVTIQFFWPCDFASKRTPIPLKRSSASPLITIIVSVNSFTFQQ